MEDDDHDDHDGATDNYVDNDGGGVMGDNDDANDDGVAGYDDDNDGDGTALTTTLMATVQWATPLITSMATA